MSLTQHQIERRKKYVTSTDVAAILGVSPYKSAYDVWLDKRGMVDPQPSNDAMELGTLLEPALLQHAENELGRITRNQFRVKPDFYLAATCDAIENATGRPVEAKTAGLLGPLVGQWGDTGTDHVPDAYLVQAHVQMIVTDTDLCHLFAFLGGLGIRHYVIPKVEKLAAKIAGASVDFWTRCVEGGQEPGDSKADLEVLKRVRRVTDKVGEAPAELIQAYEAICDALRTAELEKEALQAAILTKMGDAEAATFGDPSRWVTYFPQKRAAVDAKRMRIEQPEIYRNYATDIEYRVLRIAKKP